MTRPQTRAAARRVAARVLGGVEDAGQRLTAFARAGQPALESATEHPATHAAPDPVTVTPTRERDPPTPPSPKAPTPPAPLSRADLSWSLARHISERMLALRTGTLHTDLRTASGAHDPQAVRGVRISARRLRSFADVFGPWIGRKRGLRIQRELRTVTRVLGPLRDLDGSMAALNDAHPKGSPLLQAAVEQLQTTLAGEQRAAVEAAEHAFGGLDVRRLERDLDVAQRRVAEHLIAVGPALNETLAELFGQHAQALFRETPMPRTLEDMEAVHDVRITAKRLRYGLEWIRPALQYGPGPKRMLKRTQRIIGKARDLELRAAAVKARTEQLRDAGLTTLADALGPWLDQLEHDRGRATQRILAALDRLDPAVVVRLSQEALGCTGPSAVLP